MFQLPDIFPPELVIVLVFIILPTIGFFLKYRLKLPLNSVEFKFISIYLFSIGLMIILVIVSLVFFEADFLISFICMLIAIVLIIVSLLYTLRVIRQQADSLQNQQSMLKNIITNAESVAINVAGMASELASSASEVNSSAEEINVITQNGQETSQSLMQLLNQTNQIAGLVKTASSEMSSLLKT
ncbi:MAG: hypothetical protein ACFFAS_13020 [Promethearchaeota archaeon]